MAEDLAQYMARYNIGVRERDQDHQQDYYKIKRIDEDYFDQEAL